jgi:hypothetical protein
MELRVECYAGFRGEQEPRQFWLGERRLTVREIVDRWIEPGRRWFKVRADDGDTYILRHDEGAGAWELAAFRRGLE